MTETEVPSPTTKQVYSAPRKFDLFTALAVTTACAGGFAFMRALNSPMMVVLIVATFFTMVALGQAFLFGGRQARWSSVLVGSIFYVSAMVIESALSGRLASAVSLPSLFFCSIVGAVCGYLAGAVIGGVFLVAEFVRRMLAPKDS